MSVLVRDVDPPLEQPAQRAVPRETSQERYPLPPLLPPDRSWGYGTDPNQ